MSIINPLALTKEVQNLIKKEYEFHNTEKVQLPLMTISGRGIFEYHNGKCDELEFLFGRDFFKEEKAKNRKTGELKENDYR